MAKQQQAKDPRRFSILVEPGRGEAATDSARRRPVASAKDAPGRRIPSGKNSAERLRKIATGPTILLVGESDWLESVEASLQTMRVNVEKAIWGSGFPSEIASTTVAVILVAPPPKRTLTHAVRLVQQRAQATWLTTVFVLVPDGATGPRVRNLYSAGATAVFEWPREQQLFPRLVAELLAVEHVHGQASKTDSALERSVKAHLRLEPALSRSIAVHVREGFAFLSGSLDGLWRKDRLEELVSNVAGVKAVMTHNVWVSASGRADRAVSQAIRSVLRSTSDVDTTTLTVSVRNGVASLAGIVTDRAELKRVLGVIRHVKGVRGIENLTTVSASLKKKDRSVAHRLQRTISTRFPETPVQVSLFAGVAVLSGSVDALAVKREIEKLTLQDDAVVRVINKIEVV